MADVAILPGPVNVPSGFLIICSKIGRKLNLQFKPAYGALPANTALGTATVSTNLALGVGTDLLNQNAINYVRDDADLFYQYLVSNLATATYPLVARPANITLASEFKYLTNAGAASAITANLIFHPAAVVGASLFEIVYVAGGNYQATDRFPSFNVDIPLP
jgi:hypothetical protein